MQFDSQGVCTRLACGSLFYTRLLINLGGLFLFSTYVRKIKNFTNSRHFNNYGRISYKIFFAKPKLFLYILPAVSIFQVGEFKEGGIRRTQKINPP